MTKDMPKASDAAILADLARIKALFQLRAIEAVMGLPAQAFAPDVCALIDAGPGAEAE